ncbi:hypothetical protein [Rhodonellum sp.]|uniref:hypothetical protein n=1 Tax=Rhodonellum sp. TaxID=2231180 RepID=UPI00272492AE|nr:hypothetical protein [Rhodonellum sp.]MDO9554732.1 hypothetical protein [Rhodonellum sp.]
MSVSNRISSANAPANSNFAFQKVSKTQTTVENPLSVMDLMVACGIVQVTETASFDFPNFPEAKKSFQVIYFELSSDYATHTSLFGGLVSLGKPNGVILQQNRELGNFTLKFYASNSETVKSYLQKIFGIVEEEIRFKSILKKIIQNQQRFENEEQLLKKELFY